MKILVFTPTYNEAENIENLIPDILKLDINADVLVVDDNSPDGTGKIVKQFIKENSRVNIVERPSKMGLGTAHIEGFKFAIKNNYDVVISMDADYSHHPKFIPSLVEAVKNSDVVIGARYVPGGDVINCKWSRKKISKVANFVACTALGWSVSDATAGFRAYNINVIKSIDLDSIFSNGYSFLVETLYRCYRKGYKIAEVPIVFKDRFAGKSKLNSREVRLAMYTILRLFFLRITGRQ